MKTYHVYILASGKNGTLYIGITNDLVRRVWEHRQGVMAGFTNEYAVHQLVHFEATSSADAALRREKRLKKWNRDWKIVLIEKENPGWRDLYQDII